VSHLTRREATALTRKSIEAKVAAETAIRERDELRAALRRVLIATEVWLCSGSRPVPELEAAELEFDAARSAACLVVLLRTCANCGHPCAYDDDLCGRPECFASVPEVAS
jgi:hypothetical protein